MTNNKGHNVDAETRAELGEIKADLHSTLIKTISEEFRGLREHLSELFNKDIDHVNKRLDHFQNNHVEHYDDDKARRLENAKLKEEMESKFHALKEDYTEKIQDVKVQVLKESVTEETKDKIDEKNSRNKNTNIAFVVALFTILTAIAGSIAFLATKI